MQNPPPAPTASGTFVKTPFPHLLVYALERRLTGTFELSQGATATATMLVMGGCPAKVCTHPPAHYLGALMAELGMISPDQLQASLAQMQESPRLQGQILLEMGAIDPARLGVALCAHVERKVEHLFNLPPETTFAYYDGLDRLQSFGGPATPIDPLPVLWRGVRGAPAWDHVDAALRRVGDALLRATPSAQFERFAFAPNERQVIELLRQRPVGVVDITNVVGPEVGRLLVYLLMITKHVELLDAHAQTHTQTQDPPQPPARPAMNPQGPPSSGQAFARVQLQRQAARAPLIVEEQVAYTGMNDQRVSSPATKPHAEVIAAQQPAPGAVEPPPASVPAPSVEGGKGPPATSAGGAMDIGSMITQTIQQSGLPSVLPSAPTPDIPAAAGVPHDLVTTTPPPPAETSSNAASPSVRPLTAEQSALKAKILERAERITSQDYFQMLGVERDTSPEAVQKAFFGLAKVWHPDRLPPALADVKDACSKVFTHLTEAHATLMNTSKRQDYMTLLKDGGATPDDQARIHAILEAATEFQKAEFLLKRSAGDPQAYEIVKRCVSLDGEQADYMALLAWLDAQKPECLSREKTLEKVRVLDQCIEKNPNCERAFFYRGMLYKRIEELSKAIKDFKRAADLNPRNLDAIREVRLHNMRGGASKPPPAMGSAAHKPASSERGGLFGKLFKK